MTRRRPFLQAAALVATGGLPAVAPQGGDDDPGLAECQVCGQPQPAEMVDHTAVATTAPVAIDVCRCCQVVENQDHGEGRCLGCGEAIESAYPYHVELEFPVGPEIDVYGSLAGGLCEDCAGLTAMRLKQQPLAPRRREICDRWHDLMEEQTRRVNARTDWPPEDDE